MSHKIQFDWQDPLSRNSRSTEQQRMIAEAARSDARESLLSRVRNALGTETFDRAIMEEMGGLGVLGATLATKYGGAEVDHVSYGLIAREIERVDSGYRSSMSVRSMRRLVNLETTNTYERTHDIPALILGRGQTGLETLF